MAQDEARPGQASRYLDYLPAIYQEGAQVGRPNFLGRFLLAFEHVLTGLGDPDEPGLEEILNGITDPLTGASRLAGVERYFDPGPGQPDAQRAPAEFLPWLASWVALALREDWGDEQRRRLIGQIVALYRERGTRAGLAKLLQTYAGMGVQIEEFTAPLQVGVTSRVGVDTMVGGGPPHYFLVRMFLTGDPATLARQEQVARAIIDQEKPAHTHYELWIEVPTLQIGVHSTVGVDTLLGTPPS